MIFSRDMAAISDQPTIKALRLVSYTLGTLAIVYACAYAGPTWFVRLKRTPEQLAQQVSVVQYLETFGPIWTILFALAGISVLACAYLGRTLIIGHSVAAGVWVSYGIAVLGGAVLSEPPTPVLSGLAAIFGAITHIGMARAWAGEGIR